MIFSWLDRFTMRRQLWHSFIVGSNNAMEVLVEDVVLLSVICMFPSLHVCYPESKVVGDIANHCVPSDLHRHALLDAYPIPPMGMLEC